MIRAIAKANRIAILQAVPPFDKDEGVGAQVAACRLAFKRRLQGMELSLRVSEYENAKRRAALDQQISG